MQDCQRAFGTAAHSHQVPSNNSGDRSGQLVSVCGVATHVATVQLRNLHVRYARSLHEQHLTLRIMQTAAEPGLCLTSLSLNGALCARPFVRFSVHVRLNLNRGRELAGQAEWPKLCTSACLT